MRIVQLSDCHLFSDITKTAYDNINPYQTLKSVLEAIQLQSPDLIIFTGDTSGDDSQESYHHLAMLLQSSKIKLPVRMIAGNHDVPELINRNFPENYRSNAFEEIQGIQFLFLNTWYKGTLGLVDLAFFADSLKQINNCNKPVVIVMHHHPLDTGSWMDKHELVNRVEFSDMLQHISIPTLLLHGHIHHASEKTVDKVTVMSCPSTCWQWQMTAEFGVAKEQPGFRLLELTANNHWQTRIIRI